MTRTPKGINKSRTRSKNDQNAAAPPRHKSTSTSNYTTCITKIKPTKNLHTTPFSTSATATPKKRRFQAGYRRGGGSCGSRDIFKIFTQIRNKTTTHFRTLNRIITSEKR
ncbi:unnamed protein product [Amoebophrya sp. A120]|nr:unnamed protein product [Amoebophrya sp. A120]|eukprot:GSA120T00023919001.1